MTDTMTASNLSPPPADESGSPAEVSVGTTCVAIGCNNPQPPGDGELCADHLPDLLDAGPLSAADQEGVAAADSVPGVTAPDAAYENARRSASKEITHRVEFRSVDVAGDDGLTLEGYAAVFGEPTMIDDHSGTFRETIERGAFAKTVSERKPALLFDHGRHPMIGNMPIGSITALREDERGLYVKARLSDSWLTEPVREAIRGKAVTGMSVRMIVHQDAWRAGSDRVAERSVKEVGLVELGPVVFPAYEGTTVSTRSRDVCAALGDPAVRSEVARILTTGTDPDGSAARSNDEPAGDDHSFDIIRSRARALLTLS
jgi:HK97 family phage prohead protease